MKKQPSSACRQRVRVLAVVGFFCAPHSLAAQDIRTGTIEGTITDSVHRTPLRSATVRATRIGIEPESTVAVLADARGTFKFERLEAGRYAVRFESAMLDSLEFGGPVPAVSVESGRTTHLDMAIPSAATLRAKACPGVAFPSRTGALVGFVTDAETERPLTGAAVLVAWREATLDTASRQVLPEERFARASTDAHGEYKLCGVPAGERLVLQVQHAGVAGPVLRASVDNALGVLVRNLSFSTNAAGRASVSGSVRTEGGVPISGAQVSLVGTSAMDVTNDAGAFSLGSLPSGTGELEVRQLGFRLTQHPVELLAGQSARRDVVLERIVTLDSVAVIAQRLRFPEFESHRKLAIQGQFLGEEALNRDRDHVNYVSDIIQKTPGWEAKVVGQGSDARIADCAVAVDNMLEFPLQPRPGVPGGGPLNLVHPSDIGAIELYKPPFTSAPMQFHAKCLIMIWTKTWANQRAAKRG